MRCRRLSLSTSSPDPALPCCSTDTPKTNSGPTGSDPLLAWLTRSRAGAAPGGTGSGGSAPPSGSGGLATVLSAKSAHGRGGSMGVDVKMWMLNFEDFELSKQIGEGSFGRVRLQ